MKRLEEMEQLKKEYQEIPVPEHGIDGVRDAMERAKQKKRLRKRLISYASMAAAVVLVLFVTPQMAMHMFAGGSSNEAASMGHDSLVKDMFDGALKTEAESDASEAKGTWATAFADAATREKIEAEMTRQIQFRSSAGEEAICMILASSEMLNFEEKDAEYYLDENGQLVIVFPAGELAPEKYGEIKFVIPDEVWK